MAIICCSTVNKYTVTNTIYTPKNIYPTIVNPYAKREEELLEATVRKTAVTALFKVYTQAPDNEFVRHKARYKVIY